MLTPTVRPLKVYAFDPVVGKQLENAMLDSFNPERSVGKRIEARSDPGEYVEVVYYASFSSTASMNQSI